MLLSQPPVGQDGVGSSGEQRSDVPGRGVAGKSPGVVEGRTAFYREVFARHGVLKLVSKFDFGCFLSFQWKGRMAFLSFYGDCGSVS